jgi:hypothetical protein
VLLGIAPQPALLGKATDRAFRWFVEDMLQVLTRSLNRCFSPWQTTSAVPFARQDIFQIIAAVALQYIRGRRFLILKAFPRFNCSSRIPLFADCGTKIAD